MAPRLTDSYLSKWMLQWLQRAHQECLINTHSKEMDTDDSLKSCRVTTGGQVLGIGKMFFQDFNCFYPFCFCLMLFYSVSFHSKFSLLTKTFNFSHSLGA